MPKINKVVTTVWYNKQNMHDLRRVFPDAEFVYVDFYDKERLTEEVKDADVAIVMGDVDPCLLGENSLKWIQCDHAGLNGSARPEVFARGIPVTGAAGRSAPVLAEHAVYFMFQGCYHTKELLAAQEKAQWGVEGSESWRGLYGRTAGIIGMGNNGRLLAERLHAFGMKIIAYNRSPIQGLDYIDRKLSGKNGDTVEPLLRQSDFIILTIALTDETFHMLNKESFRQVKPGAFLVNMARGGLVCTEDLIEALKDGTLWHMPTVYITPHCTPQVPDRQAATIAIIRENARRFEAGEPLMNLMRPSDAVTGQTAEGGWARMMNSGLTKEQIAAMPLEKYLGVRGWTDPSEWM